MYGKRKPPEEKRKCAVTGCSYQFGGECKRDFPKVSKNGYCYSYDGVAKLLYANRGVDLSVSEI